MQETRWFHIFPESGLFLRTLLDLTALFAGLTVSVFCVLYDSDVIQSESKTIRLRKRLKSGPTGFDVLNAIWFETKLSSPKRNIALLSVATLVNNNTSQLEGETLRIDFCVLCSFNVLFLRDDVAPSFWEENGM